MPTTVKVIPQGLQYVTREMLALLALTAESVANDAKDLAPVDSGRLRASIAVAPTLSGDGYAVTASAPYAGLVEFGSSTRAAQPFLRPALYRRAR